MSTQNKKDVFSFQDVFTTVRNTENQNNETISSGIKIEKVGEGSFFSKIIPALKEKNKIALSVAAVATLVAGTMFAFNSETSNQNIVNKTLNTPTETSSISDKIIKNISNIGNIVKSSEEAEKNKLEQIKVANEKMGFKVLDNGYQPSKLIGELKGIKAIDSNINDVNKSSKFVNNKNYEHLNNIGKFEIAEGLANNQVANLIARFSFRNGNYYEALMVTGEGYTKTTADNIGSTIYHGINTHFQSRDTMYHLIKGVSKDERVIDTYMKLAGVSSPAKTKVMLEGKWLPPAKSLQMSVLLQESYDKGVKSALQTKDKTGEMVLDSLDENVKAATRYISYKVGTAGFAKYKNFIGAIKDYSAVPVEQRTQEMRDKIANLVSFKYAIVIEKDGVQQKIIKEDERATMLVRAMIKSPQAFAYMINEDVKPQHFESIYKDIKGDNKNFDKNNFSFPENMKTLQDHMTEYKEQGYNINNNPLKELFLDSPVESLKAMTSEWNEKNKITPKTKHCIGSTTISC